MDISVVVCTKNRVAKLRRAITSIVDQSNGDDFVVEIIVIDQSNQFVSIEDVFVSKGVTLKHIRSTTKGLARARNEALTIARGTIVAFTDDDCVVASEWLRNIWDTFSVYLDVQAVFGRSLAYSEDASREEVEHHIEFSVYGSTTYASKQGSLYCSALFDAPTLSFYDKPCLPYANLGSGNNMAYRKTAFDLYGTFVPELGAGTLLGSGEDTEFQYRLLTQGCKTVYQPLALIYHDNWLDVKQNVNLQIRYLAGVAALFVWYALRDDQFAIEILRYIFRESEREIAEYEAEHGLMDHFWHGVRRRFALLKGVIGGMCLNLIYSQRGISSIRNSQ